MKRNQKGDVWQQSRTVARKEMGSKENYFSQGRCYGMFADGNDSVENEK